MNDPFAVVVSIHWAAVLAYVFATVANSYGLIFKKEKAERIGTVCAVTGLLIHGGAIVYWWRVVGHGPYMSRQEVLTSDAWVLMLVYLVFARFIPKIRVASMVVFPATFLIVALGLFMSPQIRRLPPTLRSIWLVLHIAFYKIALGAILITVIFSVFYILKKRTTRKWLDRLPDINVVDLIAYRFAGFGFTFWAIGMLAGGIWAYQSWGRFWAWDPVETWSLITWVAFGMYLHLRRFFGWAGEKAAYFYIVCFVLSLFTSFFTTILNSSIHSQYFR